MGNKKVQNPCSKVVRQQPLANLPVPSLEDMLIRSILNTVEFNSERKRIVTTPHPKGITYEKKEGMRVNPNGEIERIKEEVNYVQTLADGTAITDNGFVRCQTCNEIVSVESIQRCPCGKTCCISKGCGCYSERNGKWYCCKKHALLAKFRINLRWIG